MLSSAPKRFILPFASPKSSELFGSEVELASIFAFSKLECDKGWGLFGRQPQETLRFVSRFGYPIWLLPNGDHAYIFDGLNNSSHVLSYIDLPIANAFIESLEASSRTKEDYKLFLSNYAGYFQISKVTKEFKLKGLIANPLFKEEFSSYRKEAIESTIPIIGQVALPLLFEAKEALSILYDLNNLQSSVLSNAERLSDCLKILNKTTSQFVTEIEFAGEAAKDEINAKIRALQEVISPKVVRLNQEYKGRMLKIAGSFDLEILKLKKQKEKNQTKISETETNIVLYEKQVKKQAKANHLIYEKRWKEKSVKTKKELECLRKDLQLLEKRIKELSSQKSQQVYNLQSALDSEINFVRKPLFDLETVREEKMVKFRLEADQLLKAEKTIVDELNRIVLISADVKEYFNSIGTLESKIKSQAIFYILFYIACYQSGYTWRFVFVAPSSTSNVGFSTKLRSAFGMSKTKELFTPRFKAITSLIGNLEELTKSDSQIGYQIRDLGEKNNLLKNPNAIESIAKGLVYLKHQGWLTDKEQEELTKQLSL